MFPNWKFIGTIKGQEADMKAGHPRHMIEYFWDWVEKKYIEFPQLSGQWIATETLAQPGSGDYQLTQMGKKLGFQNRFNVSWNQITAALDKERQSLSQEINTGDQSILRVPEVTEWNLIASRLNLGGVDSWEITNTAIRWSGRVDRLTIGNKGFGGITGVGYQPESNHSRDIGFRVIIAFNSEQPKAVPTRHPWLG